MVLGERTKRGRPEQTKQAGTSAGLSHPSRDHKYRRSCDCVGCLFLSPAARSPRPGNILKLTLRFCFQLSSAKRFVRGGSQASSTVHRYFTFFVIPNDLIPKIVGKLLAFFFVCSINVNEQPKSRRKLRKQLSRVVYTQLRR